MFLKKDTPKWKIHLFIAGLWPLAFGLELMIRLLAGSSLSVAAWDAFREANLFLLLCQLIFWYLFTKARIGADGERKSDIVTLNLNDKEI
jgi:hypothetical protein